MTLPEVLITVVITGLLITGMASATMVVLRQHDNSDGRLNNARSEQNVGIWLPSDLASAEDIDNAASGHAVRRRNPAGLPGQHHARRLQRADADLDRHDPRTGSPTDPDPYHRVVPLPAAAHR